MNEIRPMGYVKTTKEGKAHIPVLIRQETGVEIEGKIPFFLDANVVLLIRGDATREDVLKGLDVLKADLKLRWKEEPSKDE